MDTLPDDVLPAILYEACKPVPWPWCSEVAAVCQRWDRMCVAHRCRGWYLAHSTLKPEDSMCRHGW